MPSLDGGEYLIAYLNEIGPVMAVGMGAGPITHNELRAWMDITGIELQPWEARFLRRLSHEYLAEEHRAMKLDCPAPWKPTESIDFKPRPTETQLKLRALASL